MEELPSPRGNLTQEEQDRLREAFDEWLIETDGVTPNVAS
jgi:hypothetical protein